jgi:hypothetical protein
MSIKTKLITSLGVALAPWLLAVPAPAADEVFSVTKIISLPATSPGPNQPNLGNQPLASFDIEFVDPIAGVFLLADRSNKSIDVASTSTNLIISQLQPGFVGAILSTDCAKLLVPPSVSPVAPNCSGPNGVLAIHQYGQGDPQGNGKGRGQAKTEVWVGDGSSQVWALNLATGSPVVPPISTALPRPDSKPGTDPTRADELCYDPDDGIILVANPNSSPIGFVTFISTRNYKVLGHIVLNGTNGTGFNTHGAETPPNAIGGIEQCQYSQRTGTFYINVPKASLLSKPLSTDPVYDLVLQIDPKSEAILNTVNLTKQSAASAPTNGCVTKTGTAVGTTGMALGPKPQIAIACGTSGQGSVVISEEFSSDKTPQVSPLAGQTGADEIRYNPGDNHYFYATVFAGGHTTLGVVDACGETACVPENDTVATPPTAISTKAAADPVANQLYAAVNPTNAETSKICSSNKDANGKAGDDTQGCIAIFTTSGTDEPPQ